MKNVETCLPTRQDGKMKNFYLEGHNTESVVSPSRVANAWHQASSLQIWTNVFWWDEKS